MYNLLNLSDEVFELLVNLEELKITFSNFTSNMFKYLLKLKKLSVCGFNKLTFDNIKLLTDLKYLSISYINIRYSNFSNLAHIHHITLYGCPFINDNSETLLPLHLLENLHILSIYESIINFEDLLQLRQLKHLKRLNIYRCKNIKSTDEIKLKEIFPFFNQS
jgi:hypothetical protein